MSNLPPFPIKNVGSIGRKLLKPIAAPINENYSQLEIELNACDMDISSEDYVILGIENALFLSGVVLLLLMGLSVVAGKFLSFLIYSVGSGAAMLGTILLYWLFYPHVQADRKAQEVERELLFALRDLSIEINSGSSFKQALQIWTEGYGELSKEATTMIKQINTGIPIEDALYESLDRNTSDLYRATIMRIVNGLRSGTSIPALLDVVITNLNTKMENEVATYGSNINMWSTLYLVIGIVMPSMGLTVLILLSSFTGTSISETFIWLILFGLGIFHISAITILQSRRPSIEI